MEGIEKIENILSMLNLTYGIPNIETRYDDENDVLLLVRLYEDFGKIIYEYKRNRIEVTIIRENNKENEFTQFFLSIKSMDEIVEQKVRSLNRIVKTYKVIGSFSVTKEQAKLYFWDYFKPENITLNQSIKIIAQIIYEGLNKNGKMDVFLNMEPNRKRKNVHGYFNFHYSRNITDENFDIIYPLFQKHFLEKYNLEW